MYLADTLSRAYIAGKKSDKEVFEYVNVAKSVPMTDKKKG